MQILPETCLRSWDMPLNFGDDPVYDPDSGSGSLSRSLGGGLHFRTVLRTIVHVFRRFKIFYVLYIIYILYIFNWL